MLSRRGDGLEWWLRNESKWLGQFADWSVRANFVEVQYGTNAQRRSLFSDRQLHRLNSSLACATSALNSVYLENTARIPTDAACGSTSRLS